MIKDQRGWRVPRSGTVAARVYELLAADISHDEICHALGKSHDYVSVVAWRIRHPETANARAKRTPSYQRTRGPI